MLQSFQRPTPRKLPSARIAFEDEARFLRSWLERPLVTGAVTPSGKILARTMASYVDPRIPGPIIELGPGTGPVTDALIRRGVAQDRLVLVEYNPEFCQLLKRRFPKATIIQGDAYDLRETLVAASCRNRPPPPCRACRFSPSRMDQRLDLLEAAQELMHPDAPFIQFTYAVVPPIPARSQSYTRQRVQPHLAQPPPGPRLGLQQGQARHEAGHVPFR